MAENYNWTFSTIGGATRVNITNGEDIKHLGELDQKLWTVLSCPVKGLELDEKTLQYVDIDGDGKIHVNEVVRTAQWLTGIINNADLLLEKKDTIKFSSFNTENEEGKKLLSSAKQILENLGLKKDSISLADTEDNVAIFAKTALNGDGIVTVQSTEDAELSGTIAKAIDCVGSKADRSGLPGLDAELVGTFYDALAKYSAWKQAAEAAKDQIFPYQDNTQTVCDLVGQLKPKVEDFFMRCKLSAFDVDSTKVLDVSTGRIEAVSAKDLSTCQDEIAQYPLARLNAEGKLPLKGGINPVWLAAFTKLGELAFKADFGDIAEISEEQWNSVVAKLAPYETWLGSKAGTQVEGLGLDTVNQLLKENRKDALLALIEADKALEPEATSIETVNKLLHLYRDFYKLLCNFVSFRDFYDPQEKAIFQAGSLYIDERCCNLCIKVPDMGPHNATAGLSGMFLLYCNCIPKNGGAAITIAAVITDGDIAELREGKHGVFYDRQGLDYDATIVKIIDNPISIRQAFWSPYRKLGKLVEDTVNKFAADKDAKVMGDMSANVTAPKEKPAFDIAKFTGIFAAIGLAFAGIAAAFSGLVKVLAGLSIWGWLGVIVGIILLISGPAMLKAWLKLRKRNMSPLLNANGWAINAGVKVNTTFGATLTSIPKKPVKTVGKDPFADRTPFWKRLVRWFILLAAIFGILYFTNFFGWIGVEALEHEKKAPVEQVAEAPAVEEPVAE